MFFTKDMLRSELQKNRCHVVFIKADGSRREMTASLVEADLKPFIEKAEERKKQSLAEGKEVKVRPENPALITVIDIEKQDWRSIKINSIIEFGKI